MLVAVPGNDNKLGKIDQVSPLLCSAKVVLTVSSPPIASIRPENNGVARPDVFSVKRLFD
jgi:hypothetical protein